MLRSHVALVAALLSISAAAGQLCRTASVPVTPTDWNQALAIPRFDPAVGSLSAVHVQFAAHAEGRCRIENLDPIQVPVTLTFQSTLTLARPDSSVLLVGIPVQNCFFTLAPFDGVVDFAGPSGIDVDGISCDVLPSPSITLGSTTDLALFTGPSGNPGNVTLTTSALHGSIASGPGTFGAIQFFSRASCVVTVCYEYALAVTPYCFGTNAACPCGNGGFNGGGCDNSSTGWGAGLIHEGVASVSADTLLLYAHSLPASASTLFFQGTTRENGGLGSAFGDGLRCADGSVVRLGVKTAAAGVASYPGAGDASVSVRGNAAAGDVRTYQAWYRDVASWCTADTFNLTQGLEVRWAL